MTNADKNETEPSRGCGRMFILLVTGLGIVASVFSAISCDFFEYQVDSDQELPSARLTGVEEGAYGVFGYSVDDSCIRIDNFNPDGFNSWFFAAQICAVAAPIIALAAWALTAMTMFCTCSGSYAIAWSLTFVASLAQGGTFLISMQKEFCYDDGSQGCELGLGGTLSMVSAGLFFFATLCWCCIWTDDLEDFKDSSSFTDEETVTRIGRIKREAQRRRIRGQFERSDQSRAEDVRPPRNFDDRSLATSQTSDHFVHHLQNYESQH